MEIWCCAKLTEVTLVRPEDLQIYMSHDEGIILPMQPNISPLD
jgi:hypothetical protein